MTAVLILIFLVIAGVAILTWRADPENWTATDSGFLSISLLLGFYFFLLPQHVNRTAQRRAEALADAELITSTGLLAMSSARSLGGSDASALRVAADARAALKHYPHAAEDTQKKLLTSVIDAYIDLAFSTFSHADSLARSVWSRLCQGAADVVAEADALASARPNHSSGTALRNVADHVCFVELLGRALHENPEPDLADRGSQTLSAVWDVTKLPFSRPSEGDRTEDDETIHRLNRFETLYKDELTVLHDWEVLRDNAGKLSCEVELVDCGATDGWLAPWYVGPEGDGRSGPVNVIGGDLDERARYDTLQVDSSTPRWPHALVHGRLPRGMRTKGIDSLCHVLQTQPSPTICVLVYEFRVDERSDRTERLVLDGNHRLAAARHLSLHRDSCSDGRTPAPRFRVLTFLIRERQPVDELTTASDPSVEPDRWKGFTPDIGLIRGTWLPDRSIR